MTATTGNLFTGRVALALFFAAGAFCVLCGAEIAAGFLLTQVSDGQPVCAECATACDPAMAEVLEKHVVYLRTRR